MVNNRSAIILAITALMLVQLACGITINTGGVQAGIPMETSIAMTIAALPAGKPANPPVVSVNPTTTLSPSTPQDTPTPSPPHYRATGQSWSVRPSRMAPPLISMPTSTKPGG